MQGRVVESLKTGEAMLEGDSLTQDTKRRRRRRREGSHWKAESSPVVVIWSSTVGRWGLGVKVNKVSQVLRMIFFKLDFMFDDEYILPQTEQ